MAHKICQVKLLSVRSVHGDSVLLCKDSCAQFFSKCLSYMDIREVLHKRSTDNDFRVCTDEGRKNFGEAACSARIPEEVASHVTVEKASVFRFTALNADDFEEAFGKKPLKRYTRCLPSCTVKGFDKNSASVIDELVYLFVYDPQSQYRTLEFRISTDVQRQRIMMASSDVCFDSQGVMVFDHFGKADVLEGNAVPQLTQAKTMDAYIRKFIAPEHQPASATPAATASNVPQPTKITDRQTSLACEARNVAPRVSDESSVSELDTMFGNKKAHEVPSENSTPASKHRLSGKRRRSYSFTDAAADDAASACASGPFADDASVATTATAQGPAASWIARLNPVVELEKGNLGVQQFHAKEAMKKLPAGSSDQRLLAAHIEIFEAHRDLHEKKIFKIITREELMKKLRIVMKFREPIPPFLEANVMRWHLRKETVSTLAEGAVRRRYKETNPWIGDKAFDVERPCVAALRSDDECKLALWTEFFLQPVWSRLCESQGGQLLSTLVKEWEAEAEHFLEDDVDALSPSLTESLMEFIRIATVVRTLGEISKGNWESWSADFMANFEELHTQGHKDGSIFGITLAAAASCDLYRKPIEMLTTNAGVVSETIPQLLSMKESLATCTDKAAGTLDERLPRVVGIASDFARVQQNLSLLECGQSDSHSLQVHLVDALKALATDAIAADSREVLETLSKAVAAVSDVLPFDANIPSIQAEIADKLRCQSAAARVAALNHCLAAIQEVRDVAEEPMQALKTAQESLGGAELLPGVRDEVVRVVTVILRACTASASLSSSYLNISEDMVGVLPDSERPPIFKLLPTLKDVCSLEESLAVLKAEAPSQTNEGGVDPEVAKAKTHDVHVHALLTARKVCNALKATGIEKLETELTSYPDADTHNLLGGVKGSLNRCLGQSGLVLRDIGLLMFQEKMAHVRESLVPVQDVAHGMLGGEKWDSKLKSADSKSFASLYAYASKTLLATKPVAKLRPAIQKLMKDREFLNTSPHRNEQEKSHGIHEAQFSVAAIS